jgi:hypothetical protein
MMALIDSNAARAGGTRDLRRSRKTRGIDLDQLLLIGARQPPGDANAHLCGFGLSRRLPSYRRLRWDQLIDDRLDTSNPFDGWPLSS